jgi:hypothetical protein
MHYIFKEYFLKKISLKFFSFFSAQDDREKERRERTKLENDFEKIKIAVSH